MAPKTERFEMRLDPELLGRIAHWADQQSDRPSRAEAMRRLVERGLSQTSSDMQPNAVERLSLWMLAELLKQQPDLEDKKTPNLIQDVIYGGHFWALDWEMQGVLHNHVDSKRAMREVVDALDMWNFIERAHESLSDEEKGALCKEVGPVGKTPQFSGFDGNNETEHMGIARFMVEDLGRFARFKGRSFNSHMPKVEQYGSMFQTFDPIRRNLEHRELNLSEMIEILKRG